MEDLKRLFCQNNAWKQSLKLLLINNLKKLAILWEESDTIKILGNILKIILKESSELLKTILVLQSKSMKRKNCWIWCVIMHFIENYSQRSKVETCGGNFGPSKKRFPLLRLILLYVFTFAYLCKMSLHFRKSQKLWIQQ